MAPADIPQSLATAMTSGFDKLERLFSKKKAISIQPSSEFQNGLSRSTSLAKRDTMGQSPEPLFPQPSFIRPKSSKMVARQEQRFAAVSKKPSRTELNSTDSRRLSSIIRNDSSSESIATTTYQPSVPIRTSSLFSRSDYALVLTDPRSHKSSHTAGHKSPSTRPIRKQPPQLQLQLDGCPDLRPSFLRQNGMETPPSSDQDDGDGYKPQTLSYHRSKPLPHIPLTSITPELSPLMTSFQDDHLVLNPKPLLRRDSTETTVRAPLPHVADAIRRTAVSAHSRDKSESSDSILTEPDVNDFLGLSDDDLAEAHPQPNELVDSCSTPSNRDSQSSRSTFSPQRLRACAAPSTPPSMRAPAPPVYSTSPRATKASLISPLTTLSPVTNTPSLASHAATVAAFEIARIASRHQFDLVYIVNLWPKRMACFQEPSRLGMFSGVEASSSSSSSSPNVTPRQTVAFDVRNKSLDHRGSYAHMTAKSPLRGRFLAAYGLATMKAPFHLDGSIHAKILNNAGWVECDEPDADANQFSRGYGCAFHNSHAPVTEPSAYDADADTEGDDADAPKKSTTKGKGKQTAQRNSQNYNNRGIAFVAYRKQRADGADLTCDQATLSALYSDAEALVEMILDFQSF